MVIVAAFLLITATAALAGIGRHAGELAEHEIDPIERDPVEHDVQAVANARLRIRGVPVFRRTKASCSDEAPIIWTAIPALIPRACASSTILLVWSRQAAAASSFTRFFSAAHSR